LELFASGQQKRICGGVFIGKSDKPSVSNVTVNRGNLILQIIENVLEILHVIEKLDQIQTVNAVTN
jgi:hypothetical protein